MSVSRAYLIDKCSFLYFYAYSINKNILCIIHDDVDVRRRKKRSMNLINVKYTLATLCVSMDMCVPSMCCTFNIFARHQSFAHTQRTHTLFSLQHFFFIISLLFFNIITINTSSFSFSK